MSDKLIQCKNVTFVDCDSGISFDGTQNSEITCCEVKHCKFKNCNTGISATYVRKSMFKNCTACCCNESGFEFLYSDFNKIESCNALEVDNNDPAGDALGFVAHGGCGNLFKKCVAEGIKKSTEGEFCTKAVGFLLTGTEGDMEKETKIINCIANSTEVNETGLATAYGIYSQPTLLTQLSLENELITSIDPDTTIESLHWSPNGKYLTTGGFNSPQVRVFYFDGTDLFPVTTFIHSTLLITVRWSACGKYLAIGGLQSGTEVKVLRFDGATLTGPVSTADHTGIIFSVDWSPCGRYLAIGGNSGKGGIGIRIYRFDGSSLQQIDTKTYGDDSSDGIRFVIWSPSGKYLAVSGTNISGGDEVKVFEFNGASLIDLPSATFDHGNNIETLDWSPNGKYLAAGGNNSSTDNAEVRVLSFNGSTLSNIATSSYDHGATIKSVIWSPDGKNLAIGGENSNIDGAEVRVLSFDGSFLSLLSNYDHGANISELSWTSGGKHLAIGGAAAGGNTVRAFSIMDAPTKNIVDKNKICNTTGEGNGIRGVGIRGGGDNLFIRNIGYRNEINFSYGVIRICGLTGTPSLFENLWVPPYELTGL